MTANAVPNFLTLLNAIGNVGNAAGIQGDGPGGLNALQRTNMSSDQSETYGIQSAISTLVQNPNFQQMQPADKMSALTKITGDPLTAQKALASLSAPSIDLSNPRQAIQTGVQTGNIPAQEGVQDLMNPIMGMGALAQLNQGGAGAAGGANGVQPAAGAPVAAAPATSGAPAPANAPAMPQATPNDGLPDDANRAMLAQAKQVNPIAASMAEEYLLGNRAPPSGKEAGDPQDVMAQSLAHQVSPSFNGQVARERNSMGTNIASGKIYDFSQAANKAPFHAARLIVAHNEQGNTDFPPVNALINQGDYAGGGNAMSNFDTAKTTFVPEMAKFTAGAGGSTESDRQELDKNFTPNMSDNQLLGATATKIGMGLDAVNQTEANASKIMGRKVSIMSPEARSVAQDVQSYALQVKAGLKNSPQALAILARLKASAGIADKLPPSGAPANASQGSSSSAAPQYPDGTVIRNKRTGQRFTIKNGQLVPLGAQ